MIYFQTDQTGKQVRCKITVDAIWVPNGRLVNNKGLYFYWDCNSELFAALLSTALEKQLFDKIETIRRQSYEHGWSDAKKRKPKRTFFRFGWHIDP